MGKITDKELSEICDDIAKSLSLLQVKKLKKFGDNESLFLSLMMTSTTCFIVYNINLASNFSGCDKKTILKRIMKDLPRMLESVAFDFMRVEV